MTEKYVEFHSLETSGERAGTTRLLGKVVLRDGEVRFVGLPKNLMEEMRDDGVAGSKGPSAGLLFPKDGIAFLEALRFQYTGSYLRASEVLSKGEG